MATRKRKAAKREPEEERNAVESSEGSSSDDDESENTSSGDSSAESSSSSEEDCSNSKTQKQSTSQKRKGHKNSDVLQKKEVEKARTDNDKHRKNRTRKQSSDSEDSSPRKHKSKKVDSMETISTKTVSHGKKYDNADSRGDRKRKDEKNRYDHSHSDTKPSERELAEHLSKYRKEDGDRTRRHEGRVDAENSRQAGSQRRKDEERPRSEQERHVRHHQEREVDDRESRLQRDEPRHRNDRDSQRGDRTRHNEENHRAGQDGDSHQRDRDREEQKKYNERHEREWDRHKGDNVERQTTETSNNNPQAAKEEGKEEEKKEEEEKEEPNFELSGKLTEFTNTYKGVVIKYNEPPEARKPRTKWRMYAFKGDKELPMLPLHRQSAFLLGRNRMVADIPVDHPSCSSQHAVLQFRLVDHKRPNGVMGKRIKPYVIDLESSNGTFINNNKIEARRYVELIEKDVLKFGFSSREYVILHEKSKDDDLTDEEDITIPPPKNDK